MANEGGRQTELPKSRSQRLQLLFIICDATQVLAVDMQIIWIKSLLQGILGILVFLEYMTKLEAYRLLWNIFENGSLESQ